MTYYKTLDENGKLIMIGTQNFPVRYGQIELTEAEYNTLLAEIKSHAEAVQAYAEQVKAGEITLDDVPEDYREEVEAIINQPIVDPEQEEIDALLSEVSNIGY